MISAAEIKNSFQQINDIDIIDRSIEEKVEGFEAFVEQYKSDERKAVATLIKRAEKEIDALKAEKERLLTMLEFEKQFYDKGNIAGIDEVGRGPLAGPVVTAAVILPKDFYIPYLNDSKKVKEQLRERLYDVIMKKAVAVAVGINDETVIDKIGIAPADSDAMKQAALNLKVRPDFILVDAFKIPGLDIEQFPIIKGDAKSLSIAAASIIAKVTRDRMMTELDAKYPGYGFAVNKGYGTAEHINALKTVGPCKIHRRSFIGNFVGGDLSDK